MTWGYCAETLIVDEHNLPGARAPFATKEIPCAIATT